MNGSCTTLTGIVAPGPGKVKKSEAKCGGGGLADRSTHAVLGIDSGQALQPATRPRAVAACPVLHVVAEGEVLPLRVDFGGTWPTAVVEAVVPNGNHRLLPGAFVSMRIAKPGAMDGMKVPATSIVSQGGQSYVWVAKGGADVNTGCSTLRSRAPRMGLRCALIGRWCKGLPPPTPGRSLPWASMTISA